MSEVDTFPSFYLPHHPVVKYTSLTTKVRVVFDASAKSDSNISSNELQFVGPTLQRDLFSILVNFRQYLIVLSADIAKMYRQIKIRPEDRRFQRIFWREKPSDEISCYELNTVTYGTSSAPYLAIKCLMLLAEEYKHKFPKACSAISNFFYVDDLLTEGNSLEEVQQLQQEIQFILGSAGFELGKYVSNNRKSARFVDFSSCLILDITTEWPLL
ncbi:hypothetical protein ILUMI_27331 [Ignelater luminosus]|uniref:Reverse transcriptase domain-containing protein n=1 Tax=Ignelater luminosus TaxID=2038154 RepID=A0A8K0C3J2_IGNLU|nr:hypothetical protein ILUMI_27331 [Ignelater luminosus]